MLGGGSGKRDWLGLMIRGVSLARKREKEEGDGACACCEFIGLVCGENRRAVDQHGLEDEKGMTCFASLISAGVTVLCY